MDIHITYPEANSHMNTTVEKILERQEKEKKKKFLQSCLERRRYFTPFMTTTDGLMRKGAQSFIATLATLRAKKWRNLYSQVMAYL